MQASARFFGAGLNMINARAVRSESERSLDFRWSGMDSNVQFRCRLATVRCFVRVGAIYRRTAIRAVASLGEPIELSDGVRAARTHHPGQATSHQGRAVSGASDDHERAATDDLARDGVASVIDSDQMRKVPPDPQSKS
jgi:hypothetical protein